MIHRAVTTRDRGFVMSDTSPNPRLSRSFFDQPTETVARELLGKALIRRIAGQLLGGLIVETEAYLSSRDPASHSTRGPTRSNAAMFDRYGTLYVYPIHAKHCMNVVTGQVGEGSAVLIRAIEPVWGLETMMEHRGMDHVRQLTRGPARLCQALQIDRRYDRVDLLTSDEVWFSHGCTIGSDIIVTSRIGISAARDLPLRFFIDGNWFVSGRAREHRTPPSHAGRLWRSAYLLKRNRQPAIGRLDL
jgi:DNA-3-methyladenine glycosylase